MLKKKDLKDKLKKVEKLLLSELHFYGKNAKKREEKMIKDLRKYFSLKSTQNSITFHGCEFSLEAKKFENFVSEFSRAEVNFFVRFFTTNRMKLSLIRNHNFEAVLLEDYFDFDTNIQKREHFLKSKDTVFFVVADFFHCFLILVRNSTQIFEGKPAQVTLFDSADYYDADQTKSFVKKMYGLSEKDAIDCSIGTCPKQTTSTCALYTLLNFLYLARRIVHSPAIDTVEYHLSDQQIYEVFYKVLIIVKNLNVLENVRTITNKHKFHFSEKAKAFFAKYGSLESAAKIIQR